MRSTIYGETDDIIVTGEVKAGLSARRVKEFDERVKKLLRLRPEMREKRMMKVPYAMAIRLAALNEDKEGGILVAISRGFVE